MTAQLVPEVTSEVLALRSRERALLARARRAQRLAEDCIFFGEDDYYDHLEEAKACRRAAHLFAVEADRLSGRSWHDFITMEGEEIA